MKAIFQDSFTIEIATIKRYDENKNNDILLHGYNFIIRIIKRVSCSNTWHASESVFRKGYGKRSFSGNLVIFCRLFLSQ